MLPPLSQNKSFKREACTQHLAAAFDALEQASMGDLVFNSKMPRGEPHVWRAFNI
jgi:hypothetical protein